MKKILTLITLVIVANLYSQNVVQEDFTGVWKIKQKNYNDTFITFDEYLRFINNEIHFFKIESGKEVIQSVITFEFINSQNEQLSNKLIRFKNGEVWELRFRNIKNETRLIWDQKKNREGKHIVLADDRGIIRDSEKRKKALEGEINTYYIKLK